jgi:hypothetical protein
MSMDIRQLRRIWQNFEVDNTDVAASGFRRST